MSGEEIAVPLHSLRIVLRLMRPATEAGALTATEESAYKKLAGLAGIKSPAPGPAGIPGEER